MSGATGDSKQSSSKAAIIWQLLVLFCWAFAAYVVFIALMYSPVFTAIVLRPDRSISNRYGITEIAGTKRQECFFESHGSKLHGWLFQKPGGRAIVVVHHGNAGNIVHRLHIAEVCLKAGASVFLYDYRGYGRSEGTASIEGILEDGLAAEDYVLANCKLPVVINYGESIGSAVACYVDAKRKSAALLLQSGIASLPNVAKDGIFLLNIYPAFIWPQPQLDNCVLLAKSKTPLLLIHGMRDRIVPESNSKLLYDASIAADKALVKLPDCGHNDVGYYDLELYQKAVTDFVGSRTSSQR